jgi:hypothetical protein
VAATAVRGGSIASTPRVAPEIDELNAGDDNFLSPEERRRQFDAAVLSRLGISGEEFIRRYDAGEYADIPGDEVHRDIIELALLGGFGR